MQKKRVAIISQKDTLWSLYAWNTFILTNSKYEVVGICVMSVSAVSFPKNVSTN